MIGERLLDLRKDAGLSQDELSAILQVNKHSISSYERDKSEPPDEIKIKIAKYFGVSIDYLLGVIDNPKPYIEHRAYIRLPLGFPSEALFDLKDYINYLVQKYKRQQE